MALRILALLGGVPCLEEMSCSDTTCWGVISPLKQDNDKLTQHLDDCHAGQICCWSQRGFLMAGESISIQGSVYFLKRCMDELLTVRQNKLLDCNKGKQPLILSAVPRSGSKGPFCPANQR
ncbi:hypothetical protein ACP4OV_021147 [Aristida adscensionis]